MFIKQSPPPPPPASAGWLYAHRIQTRGCIVLDLHLIHTRINPSAEVLEIRGCFNSLHPPPAAGPIFHTTGNVGGAIKYTIYEH